MSYEDKTRKYSVYISNMDNSVTGSGVLFYPGGSCIFVFTCAHVVKEQSSVEIFLLKSIDESRDLYKIFITEVPSSQIVFSPMIGEGAAGDFAIIQVQKPDDFDIEPSEYFVGERSRNCPVYSQGYPNGVPSGQNPIEYLECLHGSVVVNVAGNGRFTIRIQESHMDQGNRLYELYGISGAPVWDAQDESLLGLISEAYDSTAQLSKVFATKVHQIRSLMKERFDITIERKLVDIPEEDVAGSFQPVVFDGTIKEEEKSDNEQWIEECTSVIRCCIDGLQMQKAIDISKEAVADSRFDQCSKDSRKRLLQHLLYCYEICDLDEDFDVLEEDMRNQGLLKNYDVLRHLTRSFMKREFKETIDVAEKCLVDPDSNSTLVSCAKAFRILAKAYIEELPVEDTIGTLLDENEKYVYSTEDIEDDALIYQMIGYVYGEHYHDYVNAVRFLNRSYRVGFDSMVLESLGAAYYNLGVYDATDENGKIPDTRKIDRKALYKARECYLIIMGKADELFWRGTIRRMGLCVYNTFVFLQDNYRILTVYPDIKKYLIDLPYDLQRDVELKFARVIAQSGNIRVLDYPHLHRSDRILLDGMAETSKCLELIDQATISLSYEKMKSFGLDKMLKDTLAKAENAVRTTDKQDRLPLYCQIMNLYGRGMQLFGWKKIDKLKYYFERIKGYEIEEVTESFENFIYEYEAPLDQVIERFNQTFENRKCIETWQELNHLYIRHGMMDAADAMYKELISERKELIVEGPEYAYRAFIDYVIMYRRDLKYALQCYLDAKEAFQDTDIEGFWELELMLYSSSFNDPERFEAERRPFVEKGLVSEEQYHRGAFIAYLTNLNEQKAFEHNEYIRRYPHFANPQTGMLVMQREEIHFLNWIGAVQPSFLPPPQSMGAELAASLRTAYTNETWHHKVDKQFKNQFMVSREAALDAWALFQLAETNSLAILDKFDRVYITHMTIIRLFEELSRTNNAKIRGLLDFLKVCKRVQIRSAAFKAQLEVRNVAKYFEQGSTVAIGVEKDCVAILGEPMMDELVIEHFGNRIIRINEIGKLFAE